MCGNQIYVGGRHLCWQRGEVGGAWMHREQVGDSAKESIIQGSSDTTETRDLFLISCCFLFYVS